MKPSVPSIAVVASGPTRKGILSKLPALTQFLGPVKAESHRVASRISNVLKAGKPATHWEDLDAVEIVVIYGDPFPLRKLLTEMAAAPIDWKGKILLACDLPGGRAFLSGFARKGAVIASLLVWGGASPILLVDSEPEGVVKLRKLFIAAGARAIFFKQGVESRFLTKSSKAEVGFAQSINLFLKTLTSLGLKPADARTVAARLFVQTLRRKFHDKIPNPRY